MASAEISAGEPVAKYAPACFCTPLVMFTYKYAIYMCIATSFTREKFLVKVAFKILLGNYAGMRHKQASPFGGTHGRHRGASNGVA